MSISTIEELNVFIEQKNKRIDAEGAARKQAVIDAAHGEGLELNCAWDAGAAEIDAAHAAALIHNAWYDAETSRLFATIPVVAIETVPALDWPHQVGRPELSILADTAGDEPATDAEIIADLLMALRRVVAAKNAYSNMSNPAPQDEIDEECEQSHIAAIAAIERAEGRAA